MYPIIAKTKVCRLDFRFISQNIDLYIKKIDYQTLHIKKPSSTEGCGNTFLKDKIVYTITKKSS